MWREREREREINGREQNEKRVKRAVSDLYLLDLYLTKGYLDPSIVGGDEYSSMTDGWANSTRSTCAISR